ncbi:MAG: magnesium transporter [Deltaproteobacteria bacterium]|nr:magnesium transporter [Deltaproteobacteria bacterium]
MNSETLEEDERITAEDLRDAWPLLDQEERVVDFGLLDRGEAEDFLLSISGLDLAGLVMALPKEQRRSWVRLLPPDDAADLLQAVPAEDKDALFQLLDDPMKREVTALLAYAEDRAGGLMNPRYARLRPELTVDEAINYLRKQAKERLETIYYVYVIDEQQRLLGVVSFRELFAAKADAKVKDVMHPEVITVGEQDDQEKVSRVFADHDLYAVPVVDAEGRIKGIVTVDDIVDVVEEEATEDIQKLGGMQALEAPYLHVAFFEMLKKRGGWLAVLFLGEMITASAMAQFEDDIAKAVVLALFVPLIISSGGNSGSQATTLVIRAMALGEVRMTDWWRVVRREIFVGLALGLLLGCIGFLRVYVWHWISPIYGEHYLLIGLTVMLSLIGVVITGTVTGSLLPFVLRRFGLDPASASAPFVATIVDVTGLLLYFSVASVVLAGTLL